MMRCLLLLPLLLVLVACQSSDQAETEIRAVMQAAEDGWNAGDLEQYMGCYWRSEELRFAGGDKVDTGWEKVLANYQKSYPDRATMGRLAFTELDVSVLAEDAAVVFGRWRLTREGEEAAEAPRGVFTLVMRKTDGAWRIVHDHTSAAE